MPRNDREASRLSLERQLRAIGFGHEDAKNRAERFSDDMDSLDMWRIEELVREVWQRAEAAKSQAIQAEVNLAVISAVSEIQAQIDENSQNLSQNILKNAAQIQ